MNDREKRWREEFLSIDWKEHNRKWNSVCGETIYLAALLKAQEEIDRATTSLGYYKGLFNDSRGEIQRLQESIGKLKIGSLKMSKILQKLQSDIDLGEHLDEFWLKDLFPEAQEIEKRDKLLERVKNNPNKFFWEREIAEQWLKDYEELKK